MYFFLFNFLYLLVYFLIILFKLLFLFFLNLKFKDMHSSNSHLLYYYTYYFLFLFAHPFSSIMHTLYLVVFVFSVLFSQSRVVAELRADLNWLPRRFGMNSNQTTNQQNTKLAKTATDGCDDGKSQRRLRYIYFLDFLRPLAVYALLVYKHTQPHTHTCAHTLKSVWSQSYSALFLLPERVDVYVMLLVLSVILLFQRVIVLFLLLFRCVSWFFLFGTLLMTSWSLLVGLLCSVYLSPRI